MAANETASEVLHRYYGYEPSMALAATALALFALAAVAISFITQRRRCYRYTHTASATALLEAIGYAATIATILKAGHSDIMGAFIVRQALLIFPPNILQWTLYKTLGVMLRFCPEYTSSRRFMRSAVVTWTFTAFDIAAILVQCAGVGVAAAQQVSDTPDQATILLGNSITLAGLALQLATFAIFTALLICVRRHPQNAAYMGERRTRRLLNGLYVAIVCLFVRNIFRFAEFTQNTVVDWPPASGTFLLSHNQPLFYCLDTLPMLTAFAAYIAFHPSRFLPPPSEAPCALPVTAVGSTRAATTNAEGKAGVELGSQPSCPVHAWNPDKLAPV